MSEITRAQRDELRRLLAEATPGEWIYENESPDGPTVYGGLPNRPVVSFASGEKDGRAIAAAHNALPGLLDDLDLAERDYAEALSVGGVLREKLVQAEADAIGFAWDVLSRFYDPSAQAYDDGASTSAKDAAEHLAERGLLEHVGGRMWRRITKPEEGEG